MADLKTCSERKKKGIHYTPPELAKFLANQIWIRSDFTNSTTISVLDPACGDGQLLKAIIEVVDSKFDLKITGFETEPAAAELAYDSLKNRADCEIFCDDFLDYTLANDRSEFDIVISNPPYVRTQNLSQNKVQQLRSDFELSGRVDLYQAFAAAITKKLKKGGMLGLLTSNRFMYVQSGKTMRRILLENYDLQSVFDLGDSRLFKAAVLPVVLIGTRTENASSHDCKFVRVDHEKKIAANDSVDEFLKAVSGDSSRVALRGELYRIQRGRLCANKSSWILTNADSIQFRSNIKQNQVTTFGEISDIKVGIKTTADSVFIREDWKMGDGDAGPKPESELLRSLITHHSCKRWISGEPTRQVLYPYENKTKRQTIELCKYPDAKKYLTQYKDRLSSRQYLIDAGRDWFEIWVPQKPSDWSAAKIVWPDISPKPCFSIDVSGAIVNGDCYWIKLKPELDQDWLYLMLGVANSKMAVDFYDHHFHNKLYSGRRRFMTQYVKEFPLPDLRSAVSREIVGMVKQLVGGHHDTCLEESLDNLVSSAFGLL